MKSRNFGMAKVAALSLAIIGLSALALQGRGQESNEGPMDHKGMMELCAKTCSDCQRACDACATHCTLMMHEGKKEHMATLMMCQDCATLCSAAAQIVSRGGPLSVVICEACSEACKTCAMECAKFPNDMLMKTCAEECLKCEGACQGMLKHSMRNK